MLARSTVTKRELTDPRWWARGLGCGLIALVALWLPIKWFSLHYKIGYDMIEGFGCLPYDVFLIDLDNRNIKRGDYLAFSANQMEPFYAKGTMAIKLIAGVPGDRVVVDENGVAVNNNNMGPLTHVQPYEKLWHNGKRLDDFRRNEPVPKGKLWMLGTNPRSFDSRYWGYIDDSQIVGRAIPLW